MRRIAGITLWGLLLLVPAGCGRPVPVADAGQDTGEVEAFCQEEALPSAIARKEYSRTKDNPEFKQGPPPKASLKPFPSALVTLKDLNTGKTYRGSADDAGNVRLKAKPGRYRVTGDMPKDSERWALQGVSISPTQEIEVREGEVTKITVAIRTLYSKD